MINGSERGYVKLVLPMFSEFIRDNSWGVSSKDMAEMVNKKFGTHFTQQRMKCFRAQHHIKSGLTGWYQKGRTPGTKGKKMKDLCTPESYEKMCATQYKKGDRPINEVPIGTISMHHGNKVIKVSMTGDFWDRWQLYRRYVWQQHNGPIPEGMVVIHKDGDPMNCDISNLMIASRGEMAVMSKKGYRSKNPELTEAAVNLVRLQITANKKRRKQDDGTHNSNPVHLDTDQTGRAVVGIYPDRDGAVLEGDNGG